MTAEIIRKYVSLSKYTDYPKCGIFYAANGKLITRDFCMWAVDPGTGKVFPEFDGFRIEHRDMWDEVVRKEYPAAAADCGDDHKAMPRGRVELIATSGPSLNFRITLCPCLDTADFREQIAEAFKLQNRYIEWSFGTMNYR